VRGDDRVVKAIQQICEHTGWQALDCSTNDLIDFANNPARGLQQWRGYLSKIIESNMKTGTPIAYSIHLKLYQDAVDALTEGDTTDAISLFTTTIELVPWFAEAYYGRALALERAGNRETALDEYSIAITLNPDFAKAYFNRGGIYYFQGKFEEAITDLNISILYQMTLIST
jgi:tetratricopeptide (TPR) repeat protein